MVIEHLYATNRESFMHLFLDSDFYNLEWIYTGNPFLITHSLHEALMTAEKSGNHAAKVKIMLNLAHSYEENNNQPEAIQWYKKCLSESYFSQPQHQADILVSLILNMIQCGELSNIHEYMDKLSIIEQVQDPDLRVSLLAVKSFLYAKVGYCLNDLNIEEIEKLLIQSRELFQQTSSCSVAIHLDSGVEEVLGDLSKYSGNYQDAIQHYHRALELLEKAQTKESESRLCHKLSEAYENAGNERQAFEQYSKHYQITEDLCKERSKQFSAYLMEIYNITDAEKNIIHLKKKGEVLTGSRNTDFLTGLYNRRYWDETVHHLLEDKEFKPLIISILMMDVDNFKKYNDQYGHIQGDEILRKIGGILNASVKRDMDIAARYGGEEFIILLYATGLQGSKKVASDILEKVSELSFQYHGKNTESLSLSIGISSGLLESENDVKNFIREADKALYYSKEHGKNKYTHVLDIV